MKTARTVAVLTGAAMLAKDGGRSKANDDHKITLEDPVVLRDQVVRASRRDLPDLTRWMLATGLRIGEALAVTWADVDLDAGTVEVDWKLVRITGEGLRRVRRLKAGEGRTLLLPPFAVDMLRRRQSGSSPYAPLFPDSVGCWRDPSNKSRDFRGGTRRGGLLVGDVTRLPEDLRDDLG